MKIGFTAYLAQHRAHNLQFWSLKAMKSQRSEILLCLLITTLLSAIRRVMRYEQGNRDMVRSKFLLDVFLFGGSLFFI